MDTNAILTDIVGTSPLMGFLIWFIITERKIKAEDKKNCQELEAERNKQQEEREKNYHNVLLKNHDVIRDNQKVIEAVTNKYDDIKSEMREGFTQINHEIKDIYKKCVPHKDGE